MKNNCMSTRRRPVFYLLNLSLCEGCTTAAAVRILFVSFGFGEYGGKDSAEN